MSCLRIIFSIVGILFFQTTFSQDISYTNILHNIFDTYVGNHANERKSQLAKDEATEKLAGLKKQYSSVQTYPDTIATGWHDVMMTDNRNFCKNAKVFVAGNKILQLVIDECIRLGCAPKGKISKGKGNVTITDFHPGFDVLDIYFMDDLNGPKIIPEPIKPGYVSFWTENSRYLNKKIVINGVATFGLIRLAEAEPECFGKETVVFVLKPGMHKFLAQRSGNDLEGKLQVRSGECLKYKLK